MIQRSWGVSSAQTDCIRAVCVSMSLHSTQSEMAVKLNQQCPSYEHACPPNESLADISYKGPGPSNTPQTVTRSSITRHHHLKQGLCILSPIAALGARCGFGLEGMLNSNLKIPSLLSAGSHRTGFLNALKDSPARYPFHIFPFLLCALLGRISETMWVCASSLLCLMPSSTLVELSALLACPGLVKGTVSAVWRRRVLTDLTRRLRPMGHLALNLALNRSPVLQVLNYFWQLGRFVSLSPPIQILRSQDTRDTKQHVWHINRIFLTARKWLELRQRWHAVRCIYIVDISRPATHVTSSNVETPALKSGKLPRINTPLSAE